MILFNAVLYLSLLTGCAAFQTSKQQSAAPTKTPRVLELERKMHEREEARQDRRDQNRVIAKKTQNNNFKENDSLRIQSSPQSRVISVTPSSFQPSPHMTDKQLYSELVGSYDRNNELAFFSRFQAFNQKFVKSPLAPDVIYLAGLMSLSNKNYGPALKFFNQVLKNYPSSSKAASALFAKGVTFKKMNLIPESQKVLVTVQKKYPGSPEALRTQAELKTLNR